MLNRGEGGRNEFDQRIITNYEELHSTGVPLLNTRGDREEGKKQVPEANNAIRRAMQILHKPPKGDMEIHLPKYPEKIFPRERRKGRGNIKSKDATVRDIPYNEINDLSLKSENQVNHLFPLHTTSLEGGDALGAYRGEKERDHTGYDFAVSIGKIERSCFTGMPPTIPRLISINTTFLDKHKP